MWWAEAQVRSTVLALQGSSGGSSGHYLLGLKILVLLVGEMNQPTAGRTLTSHRKAAVSFRDTALFAVFQLALTALRQLAAAPQADAKLQDQAGALPPRCPLPYRTATRCRSWRRGPLLCYADTLMTSSHHKATE